MKGHTLAVRFFYLFCLIQDDILTFFSGIFVSIALNILTSNLPESILDLGATQLLLTALMLLASFLFIRWAIIIKPILTFYSTQEIARKELGNSVCWYNLLTEYNIRKKLVIYFGIEICLSIGCFVLMVYPDCISEIYEWLISLIGQKKLFPASSFVEYFHLNHYLFGR